MVWSLKKHNRIHFLTIQDEGGTKKIVEKVLSQIKNLLNEAKWEGNSKIEFVTTQARFVSCIIITYNIRYDL